MRQGFAQTIHLNNQRASLALRIKNNEATPEQIAHHAELVDKVIGGLVEEIRHMHHDISAAGTRSRRPF